MDPDLRQSDGWAEYLESQGWLVEKLGNTKVFVRKIPPFGAVAKIQRPAEIPTVAEIDRIARKHHVLFVKIEPLSTVNNHQIARFVEAEPSYELLTNHGFVRDSSPNLATKTVIIDLTKSEDELWRDLSQDARQSVRKAQSNHLQAVGFKLGEPGFDKALVEFHQLLKETGRRGKFWTPSFDQLRKKAEIFGPDAALFLAYSKSHTPLAGTFVLLDDGTHSASSQEGQDLYASYFLLWETIKGLKAQKVTRLDLAGIYDPRFYRATQSWQGFTAFKRKFGGKEVEYPRPLIKYYHSLVKFIFGITGS